MIFFPITELVDRYVISLIKHEKTQANQAELEFYKNQLDKLDLELIKSELDNLHSIHMQIWNLESELKSGHEAELSLEEIGKRAIQIRNLNNQRIRLKNLMAEKLGCNIREIKQDHLSQ